MGFTDICSKMKCAYEGANSFLARPSIMIDGGIEDKINEVFTAVHRLNGATVIGVLIGAMGAAGYGMITGSPNYNAEACVVIADLIPAAVVLAEILRHKEYSPELELVSLISLAAYLSFLR
mgnify:CR=1 FL=1